MDRVPDWLLERYALGELPPERLAELRARIESDPALAARLATLRAEDAAFLAAWPPRRVVPGLEARAARPVARPWLLWATPALAAAAVLVGVTSGPTVVAPVDPPIAGDTEPGRAKGADPALRLYRAGPDGPERLEDGAHAHPGDLLQLAVVGPAHRYAAVVSIDGNGVVTRHGEGSALDLPGGELRLGTAYELDDAPAFERFVLVSREAPFSGDVVADAAEAVARTPDAKEVLLPLPSDYIQTSLTLIKERP